MNRNRPLPAAARRLLACACLALALCGAARAEPGEARRAADVAQVVLGISSYVRWPAPHAEILVCLVGATKYADALQDGAPAGGGLRLRALRLNAPGAAALADCQALYIGALADAERDRLYALIIGQPILAISEPIVPCSVANMFCLKFRDTQVSFDVNLDAIARSGLRVHPNALRIARRNGAQP